MTLVARELTVKLSLPFIKFYKKKYKKNASVMLFPSVKINHSVQINQFGHAAMDGSSDPWLCIQIRPLHYISWRNVYDEPLHNTVVLKCTINTLTKKQVDSKFKQPFSAL